MWKPSLHDLSPNQPHMVCVNSTYHQDSQMTSGTCPGDSGGPLVHLDRLTGISSYGTLPCGHFPQFFTSTAHFLQDNWITDNSDYSSSYEGFWCYNHCDPEEPVEPTMSGWENHNIHLSVSTAQSGRIKFPANGESEYKNNARIRYNIFGDHNSMISLKFSKFMFEEYYDGVSIKFKGDHYNGNVFTTETEYLFHRDEGWIDSVTDRILWYSSLWWF